MKHTTLLIFAAWLVIGEYGWEVGQVSAASVGLFQTNETSRSSGPLGIVGGKEVKAHSYPYLVALNLFSASGGTFCGGTLITPRFVLTAAHCFNPKPTRITIYLGRHDIMKVELTSQTYISRTFLVHPSWDSTTLQNDLALIRLPTAAILNNYVQTIKIDSGSTSLEGKTGTILGWGLTENGTQSYQLRKVDVDILPKDNCSTTFLQATTKNICTSGEGMKGGCTGDSGGPLVVNGKQVGIMSFGSTECTTGLPSVFTRLSSFYDWLTTNVGDASIFSS